MLQASLINDAIQGVHRAGKCGFTMVHFVTGYRAIF
jgi:hypothetical protein